MGTLPSGREVRARWGILWLDHVFPASQSDAFDRPEGKHGPQPKKGEEIGSPKELVENGLEWEKHPIEEDAEG